jgi:hypothetical protein
MKLQQLLEQKNALEKEIETTIKQERMFAISQVQGLMEDYRLSTAIQ